MNYHWWALFKFYISNVDRKSRTVAATRYLIYNLQNNLFSE